METINGLLRALDNKVPASIAKRLDGLRKLNEKLAVVKEEYNSNPSEDSKIELDEIQEFISDTKDDLEEDLEELLEKKQEQQSRANELAKRKQDEESRANELAKRKQAEESRANQLAKRKQAEESRANELEKQKSEEEEELENKEETPKKSNSGLAWIVGGALLLLSAGAINILGKRR